MLARSRILGSLVFVVLLTNASPPASSQCGPDGLDGGNCCSPSGVVLPDLPSKRSDVRWLCFRFCQLVKNFEYCADLGKPVPATGPAGSALCGVFDISVRLRTCVLPLKVFWNGNLRAYYSRTWSESTVAGAPNLQVWRFLVNGDLIPTSQVTGISFLPDCSLSFNGVYFSGYIDYAYDCVIGNWKVAFAFSHECDAIHHAPGTARPAAGGGFHPSRSFSIVGPGSTFVPAVAGPRSDGTPTNLSFRKNDWSLPSSVCLLRDNASPIGYFDPQNEFCTCVAGAAGQYISTAVELNGLCARARPSFTGELLVQKRIGSWTDATKFPGNEFVLFDFGYLNYFDLCGGMITEEWFEGVETVGGFPAVDFNGLPLGPEFEDLGSSNTSFLNTAPRIGAPHVCDHILNVNLP